MSTKDPRHYDVILSPVITEKATMGSEFNKVTFKVARNATKPQIKEAVEKLFDVKVKNVNTLIRQGKVKMFKNRVGQQSDVKRAIVTLEEGSPHRRDHRAVRERIDGVKDLQSDHPEPASAGEHRPFVVVQGRTGQVVDRRSAFERRAATITAASRRGSAAAATSRPIAASISAAPSSTCRRPWSGSNTIRTAPPSSR